MSEPPYAQWPLFSHSSVAAFDRSLTWAASIIVVEALWVVDGGTVDRGAILTHEFEDAQERESE
jgi:hypothetical protein